MALGKQLRVEAVRTLDYSGISGSYAPVGSPSTRPDGVLQFQNLTNASLMVSFDGIVDHFPLPANSYFVIDVTTNQPFNVGGLYLSIGTQMYVKALSGSPSSGSMYITFYYGAD
jgi:hypothetical protein